MKGPGAPGRWLEHGAGDFEAGFGALLAERGANMAAVSDEVRAIIGEVRASGAQALIAAARRFDGVELSEDDLTIRPDEIAAGQAACDPGDLAALDLAGARIEAFHEKQKPADYVFTDAQGIEQGLRWRPLARAGLYSPGGSAAYPSSVLMNAIPARVAGVERLVGVTPASGARHPLMLAALARGGVGEAYRAGGAHAIAALAFGCGPIPAVDKITGPGNVWVGEAKRQVFGRVGIDMAAGPSEILVIAGAAGDPAWIAADLMSQAEHDADAQSILITDSAAFARRVCAAVADLLGRLPRANIAASSWERHGAVIVVKTLEAGADLANRIAPEHVEIAAEPAERLGERIVNAGAIFLGAHTPEAIGDYVGGPNHVLPTGGAARHASGLSVFDFLKRSSILRCPESGLKAVGPAAIRLAEAEGLSAHAHAVALRLGRGER